MSTTNTPAPKVDEKSKPVLTWEGKNNPEGRYFLGVPQRDLTDEDVAALPFGTTKKDLVESGLYLDPSKDKKE